MQFATGDSLVEEDVLSEISELSEDAQWEALIEFDAASRIQALARGWMRRRWEARLGSALVVGHASAASVKQLQLPPAPLPRQQPQRHRPMRPEDL